MNIPPPQFLTVTEVASILRVSESHVYGQVRKGFIPAVRIGRTLRFSRVVIDRLLDGKGADANVIQLTR